MRVQTARKALFIPAKRDLQVSKETSPDERFDKELETDQQTDEQTQLSECKDASKERPKRTKCAKREDFEGRCFCCGTCSSYFVDID